jgi:hypothetical protein
MTKAQIKKEIKSRAKIFKGSAMDKIQSAVANFVFEFPAYEDEASDIEMSLLITSFK